MQAVHVVLQSPSSHNWTELRVLQINFTMQVGKCPSLKLLLIQVFAMYLCNTQGIQQGKQWSSCFSDQNSSMKVSGSEFLILQVNYSLHCWKYLWAFGVPVDNQTKWIDTWDKLSWKQLADWQNSGIGVTCKSRCRKGRTVLCWQNWARQLGTYWNDAE